MEEGWIQTGNLPKTIAADKTLGIGRSTLRALLLAPWDRYQTNRNVKMNIAWLGAGGVIVHIAASTRALHPLPSLISVLEPNKGHQHALRAIRIRRGVRLLWTTAVFSKLVSERGARTQWQVWLKDPEREQKQISTSALVCLRGGYAGTALGRQRAFCLYYTFEYSECRLLFWQATIPLLRSRTRRVSSTAHSEPYLRRGLRVTRFTVSSCNAALAGLSCSCWEVWDDRRESRSTRDSSPGDSCEERVVGRSGDTRVCWWCLRARSRCRFR
eukprot:1381803-Rhodomonas_salina.1